MKATIEGNELVIRLPIESNPNVTEKGNATIATSHGYVQTSTEYNGKPIRVNVNAIVRA